MSKHVGTFRLYSQQFQLPFSPGMFFVQPSVSYPINKSKLGIDGVEKTGNILTAAFISGIGEYGSGDSTLFGFNISSDDVLGFSTNSEIITNEIANCFNNSTINISIRLTRISEWNDGETSYVFDMYGNSDNRFRIYKNSSDEMILNYIGQGDSYETAMSVSGLEPGRLYHFVFQVNTQSLIDNDYYLKIYQNYTVVSGSAIKPNRISAIGDEFFIGCDYNGDNQWDGIMANFIMDSILWKDSIVNAESFNMSPSCSVEWHYNSDNSVEPICDLNTNSMFGIE